MSTSTKPTNTMPTNLGGRLRNTPLPLTSGLLPLFEAVVNSIHAIEEANVSTADGRIAITILRKGKQGALDLNELKKKGPDALEDIVGFRIEDNGVGFTDENMVSFRTLDSEHKVQKGCRGIGRLLWLKAFKQVRVDSIYRSQDALRRRTFSFSSVGASQMRMMEALQRDQQSKPVFTWMNSILVIAIMPGRLRRRLLTVSLSIVSGISFARVVRH